MYSELANQIRLLSLEMVNRAKASHIGSALSIADIVATLYGGVLNIDPNNPEWPERDRFILSKGHACVAVYSVLAIYGFIGLDSLKTYGQSNSILLNHVSHKVPGVEFSTGSLGHGLPFGVGKALYAKQIGAKWKTYILMSDGELGEGSNWEAILFAAHHSLDNLVAIIDYNKLQSLTTVEKTLNIEPLYDKFTAFGFRVIEVDGHDHHALLKAIQLPPSVNSKPTVVIAHTIKGKGVSFMENKVEWHYKSPNDIELAAAIAEIRGSA